LKILARINFQPVMVASVIQSSGCIYRQTSYRQLPVSYLRFLVGLASSWYGKSLDTFFGFGKHIIIADGFGFSMSESIIFQCILSVVYVRGRVFCELCKYVQQENYIKSCLSTSRFF
jgi:hypothetical protein